MILASHQPNFFPYMGYFYKIAKSDYFVFSDEVAFSNSKSGDMHNYNYIKGPQGKTRITLPVSKPANGFPIAEVRICYDRKQVNGVLAAIRQYYGKAPFFEEAFGDILGAFDYGHEFLADFNFHVIVGICVKFGIMKPTLARSWGYPGVKDERLVNMCRRHRADTYLSGSGAAAYHDVSFFTDNGIGLVYSDYVPPVYPQRYGEFIPNLSVLDWIFNMGYTLPEGWLK